MSDITMTCGELEHRLADYLDGTIGDAEREAIEAHLATCGSCAAIVRALDERPAAAAALPVLTPSRDLWSGIASRIEPRVLPLAKRGAVWTPERRRMASLVAGAAVLVAASVMLTVVVIRKPGTMAQGPAPAPIMISPDPLQAFPVDARVRAYDVTIAGLDSAVNQRQTQLDTATIRIIKKNLVVIDAAIEESRAALAKDPHNQYLTQQLTRVLDQKVGLLRTAALLPTKT
jgi:anti-sigma factor RsiW